MGDQISRQAAIDALNEVVKDHSITDFDAIASILDLPPAEPKRGTTTMRIGRTRNSVTMWYECAECGEPVDPGDTFCSGCGRELIHE